MKEIPVIVSPIRLTNRLPIASTYPHSCVSEIPLHVARKSIISRKKARPRRRPTFPTNGWSARN